MRRILLALLVLASWCFRAEAQAPRWCDSLPKPSLGRLYACGEGSSPEAAERSAFAGIARQLEAAVSDTVHWARHVVTDAAIGGRDSTTVRDTANVLTQVASEVVVRRVRIARRARAGRTHYALALLDMSRELAEFNELTAEVDDSLAAGRVAGALTLCRYALAWVEKDVWTYANDPLCNALPARLFANLRITLLDSSRALVRFGRVPVSGVRLLLRRSRSEEPRLTTASDDRGVVALPPPRGYVGGGTVIEQIDVDWIGLGQDEPFRSRTMRTATTLGVSVAVTVKDALSISDRLALLSALDQAIRDLGWSLGEGTNRPTWTLAVEGGVRDLAASLGQVPTAAVTLRWEAAASDCLAPVARGGAVDVRGVGTDQQAARADAFRRAAAQVASDLEMLASGGTKR